MFGLTSNSLVTGALNLQTLTGTAGVEGFIEVSASNGMVLTAEPIVGEAEKTMVFSQVAQSGNFWIGLALLSTEQTSAPVTVELDSPAGNVVASTTVTLQTGQPLIKLLGELFPAIQTQLGGSIRVTAAVPIYGLLVFGSSGA